MTEQEAIEFCKSNPEAAAKIIMMVEKLEARIKELVPLKLNKPYKKAIKSP